MSRARTIALAAGFPITLLAMAGQPAAATASPAASGDQPGLPPDWVMLTDDTDTITVAVPNTWTDVGTAPGTLPGDPDGTPGPLIEASTNIEVYKNTFDAPGVTYAAIPFDPDTATLVDKNGLTAGCGNETTEPYDDGAFVGHHRTYTDCGTGLPEFHVIAANPANQVFTAVVQIQITGPQEQHVVDTILDTFNMTPAAAAAAQDAPTTTAPGGTGISGSFPVPSGNVPADWTALADDSQTISISVPSDWSDTVTSANTDGSPWISASTNDALFRPGADKPDTFSVPGVIYRALDFEADTEARLRRSPDGGDCTDNGVLQYSDGAFTGHIQTFANCGGTSTRMVLVAANPPDDAFTAVLLIQLIGAPDDDTTLDGLLSSFNRASGGADGNAATALG